MAFATIGVKPGTGALAAVDTISSISYQRIKLVDGTEGSTTAIPGDSGGLYIQGGIASGATDSGNPVKIGAKYNSSPITLTDGYRGDLQIDQNAYLRIREQYASPAEDDYAAVIAHIFKPVNSPYYSPTNGDNTYGTRVTKKNVKSSAGCVYSVQVFNFGSTLGYFQLHNKATAPAGSDTPLSGCVWPVPPGNSLVPGFLSLTPQDLVSNNYHTTGIGWALSAALSTFTDSLTATDFIVNIRTI